MKNQFAKIFEVDNYQLLAIKKEDEDEIEAPFILKTMTVISGITMTTKMGFKTERKRNAAFKEFGQENAQDFINGTLKMIKDNNS